MQNSTSSSRWLCLLLISLIAFACGDSNDSGNEPDGDSDVVETEEIELEPVPEGEKVALTLDIETPIATVSDKFLSFAVDTSQVVGGHWWSEGQPAGTVGAQLCDPYDFSRPKLRLLAKALAPAYLRIGGSEADVVAYDLTDDPPEDAPEPFEFVFSKQRWDAVNQFAMDMGFEVFFTLNAGPGCRNEDKSWNPECAREWMQYTREQEYPVSIWELGNEINGYPLFHGFEWTISGEQYAADIAKLDDLRDSVDPQTLIAGPSCAFWPLWGEMAAIYPDFMAADGGSLLDVITWHYYPQQSERCPLQSLPAEEYTMLDPTNLNEINTWADQVEEAREGAAAETPVWLGESGNAQCGGQVGVSDRFVSSFWWLDQLGQMANRGQPVVVRQSLSGSDYGMINDSTLEPRPDYWMSLLWKRNMGERVLQVREKSSLLRSYAHCLPSFDEDSTGGVAVLLLNLDRENSVIATLEQLPSSFEVYEISAPDLLGYDVRLNGETLQVPEDGPLPVLEPILVHHGNPAWFEVQPTSMVFMRFTDADLPACR